MSTVRQVTSRKTAALPASTPTRPPNAPSLKIYPAILIIFLSFIFSETACGRGFDLELTTHLGDQSVFYRGDEIQLLISLNRDAYILLLYEDAHSKISRLYPNPNIENRKQAKGSYMPLSGQSANFLLRVREPFGKERFWLFASDQVFPALATDFSSLDISSIKSQLNNYAMRQKISTEVQVLQIETRP